VDDAPVASRVGRFDQPAVALAPEENKAGVAEGGRPRAGVEIRYGDRYGVPVVATVARDTYGAARTRPDDPETAVGVRDPGGVTVSADPAVARPRSPCKWSANATAVGVTLS
jgi:hypothetical protein